MEEIFWELYNANSEGEVDSVLEKYEVFKLKENWKPYGGNKGNFGTFESQQNHPVQALIEKITNSIDATLIKECKLKQIDPKSNLAPSSMYEAVEMFFDIPNGEITEINTNKQQNLSENIQIIATGEPNLPSITIYDQGEGQLPEDFEKTFLSLHKNNKANIHFVQGKFNMGSTGAVVFCGEKKYQLIASKRNKKLNHNIESNIGFTLVRRHPLSLNTDSINFRSTWYEYFCLNEFIPNFSAETLDLGLYNRVFTYGTVIKLYSYQLPRGTRSNITNNLWKELNQFLYRIPLPISVFEKRNFSNKHNFRPILGNRARILKDQNRNIEKIIDFEIAKESGLGNIPIQVIVFESKVAHTDFIKNKAIIFTQNGQIHASEGQSFISQNLGLSLIKKHTLIHVDCTYIPTEIRQDLFMSNRTHLKQGLKTEKLLDEIIDLLKNSYQLKEINNKRKNSLISDSNSDKDLLSKIFKKLPVDKNVLELLNYNTESDNLNITSNKLREKNKFKKSELSKFPSFFKINLKENEKGELFKTIPLDSKGIINIDTDVENDYLYRPKENGRFEIKVLKKKAGHRKKQKEKNISINDVENDKDNIETSPKNLLTVNRIGPSEGIIKLIIKPNKKVKAGDIFEVNVKLSSPQKDYNCVFNVKINDKNASHLNKSKALVDSFPKLPIPQKAYKQPKQISDIPWDNDNLRWNSKDIVKIISENDSHGNLNIIGIIINMDSQTLLNFLSNNNIDNEKEIKHIKDKYFLSIYLHSLFLFSILKKMTKENKILHQIEVDDFISRMIKPYASFLLYENYHIEKLAFE